MHVKAAGVVVFGIDDKCEYRRLGARGTFNGIQNECRAETLARAARGHSQAANKSGWQQRVSRQPLHFIGLKISNWQAGRGECVVAGDLARGIDRHEAVAQPAADVLRNLFPKIPIERFDPASKATPIVAASERLNNEWPGHRDAEISSRCRATALSIAGVSGGGLRMASAIAR